MPVRDRLALMLDVADRDADGLPEKGDADTVEAEHVRVTLAERLLDRDDEGGEGVSERVRLRDTVRESACDWEQERVTLGVPVDGVAAV